MFAYAAPGTALKLPLPDFSPTAAAVALQDLFALTFQFHNIDLSIDKKVELIPLPPDQIDPTSRPDSKPFCWPNFHPSTSWDELSSARTGRCPMPARKFRQPN